MSAMIHQNPRMGDMAGLREQIISNIDSMKIASLSSPQIIVSKPKDDAQFTAWVLDDARKPKMRGLHCASPDEALASLLQVTAERVAEELFHEFEEFEERKSDGRIHGGFRDSAGGEVANGSAQSSGHGYRFQRHGWTTMNLASWDGQVFETSATDRRATPVRPPNDFAMHATCEVATEDRRATQTIEEQHTPHEHNDVHMDGTTLVNDTFNAITDQGNAISSRIKPSPSAIPPFPMATGLGTTNGGQEQNSNPARTLRDRRQAHQDSIGRSRTFSSHSGQIYILAVNESCGLAPTSPVKWLAG